MTQPRLDVIAIGNAIVDVIADADDAFLVAQRLDKGSMRLIDAAEADRLYSVMGPGRELSGGSAGNTAAGLAALGCKAGYIGQVGTDQLGEIYEHDITSLGVEFLTPPRERRRRNRAQPDPGHARRAADDEHLPGGGAAARQLEHRSQGDRATPESYTSKAILWDPLVPRAAMEAAIEAAHAAGRKVAFTLSDSFCIARHRDGFLGLIEGGRIDILFANEAEITELAGENDFEAAVAAIAPLVPMLVVTRSERGAIALAGGERAEVPAEPIERLVDTTGAGDLFAAGFLAGQARGRNSKDSLKLGAIAAAEVIQHYGARPEADLKALAGDLLGLGREKGEAEASPFQFQI